MKGNPEKNKNSNNLLENPGFIDYYDSKSISTLWLPEHFFAFSQLYDYNYFFYFFHSPDEKLSLKPFSAEETNLFFNTLICLFQNKNINSKEFQGNWGLFSLLMPARNGLSCYSHYLSLKTRYLPNSHKNVKGIDNNVIENMAHLLTNVKNKKVFCEFFMNLEPGFKQTTNQIELLKKMNFDIKSLIQKILQKKIENNQIIKQFEKSFELCENKSKLEDFLKRSDVDFKNLTRKFIGISYGEYKRLKKNIKIKEENPNFTLSTIKNSSAISQEKCNKSSNTIILNKTQNSSSFKNPQKINYTEMKNLNNPKNVCFGFNNENFFQTERCDSEPDLDYIFEKFLTKKERKNINCLTDDENNLEYDKFSKKNKSKKEKDKKIFDIQEKILVTDKNSFFSKAKKKPFIINDDLDNELIHEFDSNDENYREKTCSRKKSKKIFKKNKNLKDSQEKLQAAYTKKLSEKEENIKKLEFFSDNENDDCFFKKKNIKKQCETNDKSFLNFKLPIFYKSLRNYLRENKTCNLESYDFLSENPKKYGFLEFDEFFKKIKNTKSHLYDFNIEDAIYTLSEINCVLRNFSIRLELKTKFCEKILCIVKEFFFSRALDIYSYIFSNEKRPSYLKLIKEFYKFVVLLTNEFQEFAEFISTIKNFINYYFELSIEAFYLNLLVYKNEDEFLSNIFTNFELFCFLLEIMSSIKNKNKSCILEDSYVNFLRGFKTGFTKFQNILNENINEKKQKVFQKKLKKVEILPFFCLYAQNKPISFEARFLEYLFWILPYDKEKSVVCPPDFSKTICKITSWINENLSISILIFYEFIPNANINEFLLIFIDKILFDENSFTSEFPDVLESKLKIYDEIAEIFNFDIMHFLKIKEKIINIIFNGALNGDSNEVSNYQIKKNQIDIFMSNLIEKCLFNEKMKASFQDVNIFERRVFSRVLCSFHQFDNFHGNYKNSKEFFVFRIEFFLFKALFILLEKEEFLMSSYKFSFKFLKNIENSHGFVKQMMFDFSKSLVSSMFAILNSESNLSIMKKNEKIHVYLEDLWSKFMFLVNDFLDIGKFLKNFSLNSQNLTENEKTLEKYHNDLHICINGNLEYFSKILNENSYITQNFLKILLDISDKIAIFWTFKEDFLIFPDTRLKSLELLRVLIEKTNSVDEWWDKHANKENTINSSEDFDYEKIIEEHQLKEEFKGNSNKLAIELVSGCAFPKLIDLFNSILFKPLQQKVPVKLLLNRNLLNYCCDLIGYLSKFLLKSQNEKHILMTFEKIKSYFLCLDSTFLLDNSIKIVDKCDKYPFITLEKTHKLTMIIGMSLHIIPQIEHMEMNSILKNKVFEEWMMSIYKLFGVSLFFFGNKENYLLQFSEKLKNLQKKVLNNMGSNVSSNSFYDKNLNMNFSETCEFFKTILTDENETKKSLKLIMANLLINSLKRNIFKSFENYFSFIAKILIKEPFTNNNILIMAINCLKFLIYSVEMLTKLNDPSLKLFKRVYNDFFNLIFKRPKVMNPLEMLLESPFNFEQLAKNILKFVCKAFKSSGELFSNDINQYEDILKNIFLGTIRMDIQYIQKQNLNICKILVNILEVDTNFQFPLKKTYFLTNLLENYLIISNDDMIIHENSNPLSFDKTKKIFLWIYNTIFKEETYKFQSSLMILLILDKFNHFKYFMMKQKHDLKILQIYLSVFATLLKDNFNYKLMQKVFDENIPKENNFSKCLQYYSKICWKIFEQMNQIKEYFGGFFEVVELANSLEEQIFEVVFSVSSFLDQSFFNMSGLKLSKENIIPLNLIETIEKTQLNQIFEDFLLLLYKFGSFNKKNPNQFLLKLLLCFENSSKIYPKDLFDKGMIWIKSVLPKEKLE